MAKRSPILGFNHNFRHRGLVFHVQTEDSGVNNPHIFTHLFNGGVILSSRKLTYDVGAAEEVVKALMQAQHKAMLKDLKSGKFDEKITTYFGSDPNLDGGNTLPDPGEPTERSAPHPMPVEPLIEVVSSNIEVIEQLEELELELTDIELVDADAIVSEEIEVITAAIEVVEAERTEPHVQSPEVVEPKSAEPTNRGRRESKPPRDGRRNPFDSLEIDTMNLDGDPKDTLRGPAPAGPIGETPSGAVLIHASAPESAPEPPGANPTSPGQYAQHNTGKVRRPGSDTEPPLLESGPIPAPPTVAQHEPVGKGKGRETRRPRTETLPLQSEPDTARRGVVIENPSVIVGAPPQVIGQPATPARAQPERHAREQATGSLFGKDLISEKSLDEVILAYLSEDGSNGERE